MFSRRQFMSLSTGAAVLTATGSLPRLASAADKIVIGFSQPLNNIGWRLAMTEGTQAYVKKNLPDVELLITDAQNQATKQVADIESLAGRGINVLMFSPQDAQALTPVIKEVMAQGIPVVTLDRSVNTEVTAHVGAQNRPIGVEAGAYMAKILGGKGNLIEIQGSAGASPTIDRSGGFHESIAKYPGIKFLADQYCDYTRAPALKFMEDMLQRFKSGDIQGVYSHSDEMALGALQALKEAGRLGEVKIVSIDGQETAYEAIQKGEMAATFTYSYCVPEGIQTAYKIAKHETVPKDLIIPSKGVFPDNVKDFIGTGF
jgi:ribose transport system substrate-binding protein